jgi:hypothetical protein
MDEPLGVSTIRIPFAIHHKSVVALEPASARKTPCKNPPWRFQSTMAANPTMWTYFVHGVVEAIHAPDAPGFNLGVQWLPGTREPGSFKCGIGACAPALGSDPPALPADSQQPAILVAVMRLGLH